MAWVDSHCHLQYDGMAPDAVDGAVAAGVTRIVCIGTDAEESAKAVDVARAHPGQVWATATWAANASRCASRGEWS